LRINANKYPEYVREVLGARRLPTYYLYRGGARIDMFYAKNRKELDWYISGERTDRDRLEYFERKWMRTMCQGEGNDLDYCKWLNAQYPEHGEIPTT